MSLTTRLALTYLLLTLVGMLLLGGGLVALAGRYLAAEGERQLNAQAALYAALLAELAATPVQLQALAPAAPGRELLPLGTSGRVFSSSGLLLAGDPALGPFPSRPALALLRPPVPLPASQVAGRRYVASVIAGPAGPIGVVELSRATADEAGLLRALAGLALQAALVAALVMAALSSLVARGIARPIARQTRRAEALAATVGGPAAPAPSGPDQIVALERSLDRLASGLRAYVARIEALEQSRARFFRSVSHELRTPLTAISGALENLADVAPPEQRATLATLEAETVRLRRMVDELLRPPDDGRLTLAARAPVDLADLAAEVAALLAGRASRAGVRLQGPAGQPPLVVAGDRDRLKQALINLADNALRATPPGGSVSLHVERTDAGACLLVEDTGPGVAPALRLLIWQPGVRGDDPAIAGSSGLGLALVREIAEAHGGRAYLAEHAGPGACFVIELPLST
jgi:signal transduction histidine kinase